MSAIALLPGAWTFLSLTVKVSLENFQKPSELSMSVQAISP